MFYLIRQKCLVSWCSWADLSRSPLRIRVWEGSLTLDTPSRWWSVSTRRVRNTRRGRRITPRSTSPGCTRTRTPCPWWTRPNCPYRGRTLWRTWTPAPRRRVRTARTALKLGRRDLKDWILKKTDLKWFDFPRRFGLRAWSVRRFPSTSFSSL